MNNSRKSSNNVDGSNVNVEVKKTQGNLSEDALKKIDKIVKGPTIEELVSKTGLLKGLIEKFYDECKLDNSKDIKQCVQDKADIHIKNKKNKKNKKNNTKKNV